MSALTYKDAGVDTEAADAFTDAIARMVPKSRGVLAGIGGFAAAFAPDLSGFTRPVLVSGTDGVGTKLKLAFTTGIHHTVGIDLVAMCVNDVLTTGARPLFFLDYLATGRLDVAVSLKVIEGIVEGCRQAGCALVGGETAEMPDFYAPAEYDLAGFAVGLVDEPKMVTGASCRPGDVLIGLASSGLHSNGFSLVRQVLRTHGLALDEVRTGFDRPLGEVLLTPTRIYVRPILALLERVRVNAMAHITGGGVAGNLPRVLPAEVHAVVRADAIPVQPVFQFLERYVPLDEMRAVFNMGVGFIVVVRPDDADDALRVLAESHEQAFVLGRLEAGPGGVAWA